MGFDAAGVRAASAGLGALAQRAHANGEAVLKAAHQACRLPEDGVKGGVRAGAVAFLGSPEGKEALGKALEAAWALLRGVFSGATSAVPRPAEVAPAQPAAPPASPPERPGTVG